MQRSNNQQKHFLTRPGADPTSPPTTLFTGNTRSDAGLLFLAIAFALVILFASINVF